MNEQELIDWIQLINSDNIGPVTFYKLLEKYGSAGKALKELAVKQKVFDRREAEYEVEKAAKMGVVIVANGDKAYPQNLREINDAPPILYTKGNTKLLQYPAAVSIVGARNASVSGRKIASKIAYDLTTNQVLVVSGMARGIDAAAHKGALYAENQTGATIAVLGTGVDVPYPAENLSLYQQICNQGLVVSEFLLGSKPQAANFPRRNRLVSALSSGTLVIEASLNSGSLITARMALEQGKDIFAVPGSPLEGRSTGCNKLIREGALLVENAEDILEVLSLTQNKQIKDYHSRQQKVLPAAADDGLFAKPLDNQKKSDNIPIKKAKTKAPDLADLIPTEGISLDELIRISGRSAAQTMIDITIMEMNDVIERSNNGMLVLKNKNRKN